MGFGDRNNFAKRGGGRGGTNNRGFRGGRGGGNRGGGNRGSGFDHGPPSEIIGIYIKLKYNS